MIIYQGCLKHSPNFRSDTVEHILCTSLFPTDFSVKDKVKTWIRLFSKFDKVEVKALEKILEQKQRFVTRMKFFWFLLLYLSVRNAHTYTDT